MTTIYIKPETDICVTQLEGEILQLRISGGGIGLDNDEADSNGNFFDDNFEDELHNNGNRLWDDK